MIIDKETKKMILANADTFIDGIKTDKITNFMLALIMMQNSLLFKDTEKLSDDEKCQIIVDWETALQILYGYMTSQLEDAAEYCDEMYSNEPKQH